MESDKKISMKAKRIMIQATGFGTGAGKSLIVALLSRLFREAGYNVAPYKTVNMTPVTYSAQGKEFGYSQALQAVAAGQEPDYRMNPCTMKSLGHGKFDIFLNGERVRKNYDLGKEFLKGAFPRMLGLKREYKEIKQAATRSLHSLSQEYDIICIEGSGPARLFGFGILSDLHELGNIGTARLADAPILLVTDNLDSVLGALSYIGEESRRVKGVILNKFVRDEFLSMGLKERYIKLGIARIKAVYRRKIGMDIIGVIPYFKELGKLPDLDPLIPGPKVDLDLFKKVIVQIVESAKGYIDERKIYRIMGYKH